MRAIDARSLRWRLLGASVFLALAASCAGAKLPPEPQGPGTLVIAGGAVRPDNQALFEAFLGAMPGGPDARIAVISAASASPVSSAERLTETLARYGVASERVSHVRLAVTDDEDTADVDERQWAGNAFDPKEIEKIEAAGAIWFSGGDQLRLARTLLDDEGLPTPMLAAIRERLDRGAVIGGTSAGAAVMSDPMVARGQSIAALLDDSSVGEPLRVSRGLGFFEHGLVDQHFDANARLGRMAVALARLDARHRVGFGIDEDTALVYATGGTEAVVVGAGNVTVIDGTGATWTREDSGYAIEGLVVSVASAGDRVPVSGREVLPAGNRSPTVGQEYEDFEPAGGGGIVLPAQNLARMLGQNLLDNSGATELDRYSFVLPPGSDGAEDLQGVGVRFRFVQTPESGGYWGYDALGNSRYTVSRVRLDIVPLRVSLSLH